MKKIIVTGSTSGIGKVVSKRLISLGYGVIGLARQHNKFQKNENYFPYAVDFSKIKELSMHFKKIITEHQTISGIICSAGYGVFKELEQLSIEQMQSIMNVNFLSQAILIKKFLPQLKQMPTSKIIMIGSECALEGQKKGTLYCASKFALRGFCQSLRRECASSNVSVTLINPGMVKTSFFDELDFEPGDDIHNAIDPNQIAETIILLLNMENNCVFEEINLQQMKKVIKKKSAILVE